MLLSFRQPACHPASARPFRGHYVCNWTFGHRVGKLGQLQPESRLQLEILFSKSARQTRAWRKTAKGSRGRGNWRAFSYGRASGTERSRSRYALCGHRRGRMRCLGRVPRHPRGKIVGAHAVSHPTTQARPRMPTDQKKNVQNLLSWGCRRRRNALTLRRCRRWLLGPPDVFGFRLAAPTWREAKKN